MNYKKYEGSEDEFQMAVARYLDSIGAIWCHVGNEGMHKVQYRVKAKKKGVKSGVPDILIFNTNANRLYNGLAIELKVGYNKPSEDQSRWLVDLEDSGWLSLWSNSLDEVIERINNYFGI